MSSPAATLTTPQTTDRFAALRRAPVLGLLIVTMMFCEKMLAHTYTGITIYVLPEPWKYVVPGLIGCFGVWLVLRGMGKDEVKGSMLGYLGAVLVWMSWFESYNPTMARLAQIPAAIPETGNVMAGLLGEHIFLEMSGLYCIVLMFFLMLNKDVRCRMLLWVRRRIGLADTVGKPTQGYRPNVARVAAFEYFAVTWFMYALMTTIIDPRLFGLYHPVTYSLCALVSLWGLYLLYKCTQQREAGLAIRYGIGAVGVAWFIPETFAFYEVLYEFYLRADQHPIAMTVVLLLYIFCIRLLWTTPIDERTGRARATR
ncbi:hypothetical protein FV139_02625 [Parahaliea maris]|uniref:Uncharacterized protein n=1 Tax=Parahaliea maris TaxID=2716870 RepID=A0A5C9A6Q2_9GAMM|nr:hypothetical protein [Parahaliea maris]TXS96406.1 hypothetical protein FV139_02625 [Parahaliea maris]